MLKQSRNPLFCPQDSYKKDILLQCDKTRRLIQNFTIGPKYFFVKLDSIFSPISNKFLKIRQISHKSGHTDLYTVLHLSSLFRPTQRYLIWTLEHRDSRHVALLGSSRSPYQSECLCGQSFCWFTDNDYHTWPLDSSNYPRMSYLISALI